MPWFSPASAISGTRVMRLVFLCALAALAVDQISKIWVVEWLQLYSIGSLDVFPPYLQFRMAWNTGINFGFFGGGSQILRWGLALFAIGVSVFVFFWVSRRTSFAPVLVSGGLICGGALGNALDRIRYGAVADFLNMSCCGIVNPYSFNIADAAVFAGCAGLILFNWGPDRA